MKEELLKRLSQEQDELLRIVSECVKHGDPMDTLQDFYIFCYEKNYAVLSVKSMFPKGELNTGLIFRIMYNFVLGRMRKENGDRERLKESNAIYTQAIQSNRLSIEDKLAYESNMDTLEVIKNMVSEEDYNSMVDIQTSSLLSRYTDGDGNRDMKAYQNKRYETTKVMNEVRGKLTPSDYKSPEDVDPFDTFENFKQ